jgi:hypothetical protein
MIITDFPEGIKPAYNEASNPNKAAIVSAIICKIRMFYSKLLAFFIIYNKKRL